MKENATKLIPKMSKRTALRYTAVQKMSDGGMLPRRYETEAQAVAPDAIKMLSIQRDLQRNSDVFNSLITYLLTMSLGASGCEILWRDRRKDELEKNWRHFIDNADASKRGSFLQLELWTLTELLVAGEVLLILNSNETVGICEAERIKEVRYNSQGAIQSFIINNSEKDVSLNRNNALYCCLWKRPSAVRGTPLFAPCVDNINILSAIVRSIGLSWHKQSKISLAVSTPGGTDGLQQLNGQSPDSENSKNEDDEPGLTSMDLGEATAFIAPTGSTIAGIQQTIPSATFSDSVEAMIRLIASSAGLAGDSILNSFSNYSYSSARCAHMQTQGTIKRLQSQLIYSFYRPLIKWLLQKWGYSDVDFDVILPAVPVLDDLADASAREKRLSLGLSCYEDELLSQNKSRDEFLLQKKREVIDAINIAKEIEAETGYRVAYHQFCGLSQGKTEAAVVAAEKNLENNN